MRHAPHNFLRIHLSGVRNITKNTNEALECFKLFVIVKMIDQIVRYTTIKMVTVRPNYAREMNVAEMKAFL